MGKAIEIPARRPGTRRPRPAGSRGCGAGAASRRRGARGGERPRRWVHPPRTAQAPDRLDQFGGLDGLEQARRRRAGRGALASGPGEAPRGHAPPQAGSRWRPAKRRPAPSGRRRRGPGPARRGMHPRRTVSAAAARRTRPRRPCRRLRRSSPVTLARNRASTWTRRTSIDEVGTVLPGGEAIRPRIPPAAVVRVHARAPSRKAAAAPVTPSGASHGDHVAGPGDDEQSRPRAGAPAGRPRTSAG